jgi:hypothetical protein
MADTPGILPALEAGDRSPGQGALYQRYPRRQPPSPPAKPTSTEPAASPPDPVAPLLEALDRLRATEEAPTEPGSSRFLRGVRAYRKNPAQPPPEAPASA